MLVLLVVLALLVVVPVAVVLSTFVLSGVTGKPHRAFGWYWITVGRRGIGNLFSPAVVVQWQGFKPAAWLIVTIRTSYSKETVFYFGRPWNALFIRDNDGKMIRNPDHKRNRLPRFWWNSAHLAIWFGKGSEMPNGDMAYQWKNRLLGHHDYI